MSALCAEEEALVVEEAPAHMAVAVEDVSVSPDSTLQGLVGRQVLNASEGATVREGACELLLSRARGQSSLLLAWMCRCHIFPLG